MSARLLSQRPLLLSTPLGPDYLLATDLKSHEAISQLFQFEIACKTYRNQDVPFEKLLGQNIAATFTACNARTRYYHGMCNEVTQSHSDREWTYYRLNVVPHVWMLTQQIRCRIFQRKTTTQILQEVFARYDVAFELNQNFHPREYFVQYRESDFQFACRLMEEDGIFYFFKHQHNCHKMVIANTPNSHALLDQRELKINNGGTPHQMEDEVVFHLAKRQRMVTSKVTLWDHHFQLPMRTLEAQAQIPDEITVGSKKHKLRVGATTKSERFDFPGEYAQRFDGIAPSTGDQTDRLEKVFEDNQRTARLRMEEVASQAVRLQGSSNAAMLMPGYKIALKSADTATAQSQLNGQYLLTSVQQVISNADGSRSNSGEYSYQNSFEIMPDSLPFRPERVTDKPRIQGTQTAVVTGPANEEIFTDKFGRVKVKFHWDREGKRDLDSSCWLRVASPHAGKGWGGVSIPRVGEEVVVDFLEGDPDRPIVVGRVYGPISMPPYSLPEKKMVSGMKSSSYPGGGGFNEITMDDTAGQERMFIHAQYNQDTVVGNNRTAKVGVDDIEEVGNNQTTKVGTNQQTSVGQNIVIDAGTSITLKCGASMIHMNQAGFITISGTVITVASAANLAMTAPLTEVVGGVMLSAIGGLTLVEGGVTHIGGSKLTSITSGGQLDLTASADLVAKGATIKLNG